LERFAVAFREDGAQRLVACGEVAQCRGESNLVE
jgi:hypothetical protein